MQSQIYTSHTTIRFWNSQHPELVCIGHESKPIVAASADGVYECSVKLCACRLDTGFRAIAHSAQIEQIEKKACSLLSYLLDESDIVWYTCA